MLGRLPQELQGERRGEVSGAQVWGREVKIALTFSVYSASSRLCRVTNQNNQALAELQEKNDELQKQNKALMKELNKEKRAKKRLDKELQELKRKNRNPMAVVNNFREQRDLA